MVLKQSLSVILNSIFKNKVFKTHFWVYEAPLNSFQLHFLSNGILGVKETNGKLLKNTSWKIFQFLNGIL